MKTILGKYSTHYLKNKNQRFFVSAIGTDSGKTLVSAILAKKLSATYWKPIQCGTPTDTDQIKDWFGANIKTLPERWKLSTPASPHFAAAQEQKEIYVSDFTLPDIDTNLVVEGAGGLMVPLNNVETTADLISHLGIPVVLVINHYLGSLNHSLLTINELNRRNIAIAGIVFNGANFQDAEEIILNQAKSTCWLRLPKLEFINEEVISFWAEKMEIQN